MKKTLFFSVLLVMNCFYGNVSVVAQEIFFVKQGELWKTDIQGKYLEKVCQIGGTYPRISPDGKWVAMTEVVDNSATIALLHIETQYIKLLPIPTKNSYRPMWSPDGQKIAFNFLGEDRLWKIGVIDIDGENFHTVGKGELHWTFLGCWSSSGETILYYDHTSIYEIDVQHNILKHIPWSTLAGSVHGKITCSMNDDQRYVLYHAVVENEFIPDIAGPIDAIFLYDLETGISKRVSPIGMFASEPHWISGTSQFIYTGITEHDVQGLQNITIRVYIDSLETRQPSLLVDEGEYISVSMPK